MLYRAKHPVKVHVWAGNSIKGATGIGIGNRDRYLGGGNNGCKQLYTNFWDKPCYCTCMKWCQRVIVSCRTTIRSIHQRKPNTFPQRMHQLVENASWIPRLCNPIQNLWHELKDYIQREVKPWTKEQLAQGIQDFWDTIHVHKLQKYIQHLHLCKVTRRVTGLCHLCIKSGEYF